MNTKLHIEELVEKFYLKTITNEELTQLINYFKDNEPQGEVLEFYQNIWNKSSEFNSDIDSKMIYNQIVNTINLSDSQGDKIPAKRSPKKNIFVGQVRLVMRYAAFFILAFGLSWLVHSYFGTKPESIPVTGQNQRIEVPYGSKSRIVLPDGSVVNLNSGSTLQYSDTDFNSGSRSVLLTGEGFFNVTKDSGRPFYVTTPGLKIKVLGTTFNVKAYLDEDIEEATLVSGRIEIYASSDHTGKGKSITLMPNQHAIFLKANNDFLTSDTVMVSPAIIPVELRTVNLQPLSKTEQTICWKDNKLIFDNESFSSVMIRLERWYDVKIIVNYPELNSARFTGKFDKETIEQVLNAFTSITPFNFSIKQNLITISKNGNLNL